MKSSKKERKFPRRSRPMNLTAKWKIGDEWRHFQNISNLHVFILPTWWPDCFYQVCLFFFVDENSSPLLKQRWHELAGFSTSLHDVTTHSETHTFFCTRSSSLGMAEAWTLKLDLRALKSENPIFFLEYLFTHYRATITIKILWAV